MRLITQARFRVNVTPPEDLNPNKVNSNHWGPAKRRDAAAKMKEDVRKLLFSAMNEKGISGPIFAGRVRCDVAIYWGSAFTKVHTAASKPRMQYRKHWDDDNVIAALKSTRDAIEAAGIVDNDRQISTGDIVQDKDPDGAGYMVLTLTAIDAIDAKPCECGRERSPARAADVLIGLWCEHCGRLTPAKVATG